MQFNIRDGLDIPLSGAPRQEIEAGSDVDTVALLGVDFRNLRPKFLVRERDKVKLGQPVFVDRRRKSIVVASPAAGVVKALERNSRNSFERLVIHCEGEKTEHFDLGQGVRKTVLSAGLWPTFVTRPFGNIPDPDEIPDAILVRAIDTSPLAGDPSVVIRRSSEEFSQGLKALTQLTSGPVYLCQADDDDLCEIVEQQVQIAKFKGRHPAGLTGVHLGLLRLTGRQVWQIDYQFVIAIGGLMINGHVSPERVLAIGGPAAKNPRLVKSRIGANLEQLLSGEINVPDAQVFSGSILSGRRAMFSGLYHTQVSLLPGPKRRSGFLHRLTSAQNAIGPIIPSEAFEGVLARHILPVPLMRSLAIGDYSSAERLGALQLLEEDVALLSYLCTSGNDYGALLRRTLDNLAGVR